MESKARVLIVDDDPHTVEALAMLLEDQGYDVARARNGKVALEQLQNAPLPRAIILDLLMPVMDGWEFRRQQEKIPGAALVPIIVVSALKNRPVEGAAAMLAKPLDVDALLQLLKNLCS
jgi:two-component system chemotaxis response regulator CheY